DFRILTQDLLNTRTGEGIVVELTIFYFDCIGDIGQIPHMVCDPTTGVDKHPIASRAHEKGHVLI
ncbi:hypothetical protein HKBW3S47_02374, partial [Candidatus Hakubella thermalkaliphila]